MPRPLSLTPEQLAQHIATNVTHEVLREIGKVRAPAPPIDITKWRPGPAGRQLRDLLAEEIRPKAAQIVSDGEDRRFVQVLEQIKSICEGWAEKKWGKSFTSTVHGRNLWSLVTMTLFRYQAFGMDDTLPLLYKLWKSRQANQPSAPDRESLTKLLQRFQITKKTSNQVLKEAEKVSDPVLTLLDEFFSVRNRYWARFFDKDGKLRKKQLPNLPDARLAIVAALKNPKKHWWVKNGDPNIPPLLAKDYYDLTNQILSVVFPGRIQGTSVKQAVQYQLEKRRCPSSK